MRGRRLAKPRQLEKPYVTQLADARGKALPVCRRPLPLTDADCGPEQAGHFVQSFQRLFSASVEGRVFIWRCVFRHQGFEFVNCCLVLSQHLRDKRRRRTKRGSQPLGLVCRSLSVSFFVHIFRWFEFSSGHAPEVATLSVLATLAAKIIPAQETRGLSLTQAIMEML